MGGLIVCNPGNPSGKVYSRADLERLVETTGRYNCLLIMDEIYGEMLLIVRISLIICLFLAADLVWEGNTFYSPVQTALHKHVVACRGFSKNVACQSWRVGYLISHPETVDAILNFHDPIYISVPILQVSGAERRVCFLLFVFSESLFIKHALAVYLRDHLDDYVAHIAKSNAMMQANLAKLGKTLSEEFGWTFLRPQGSMYAMFRHKESSDLAAVVVALKRGVGVAGGGIREEKKEVLF